jgi:hypothetical protein
VQPPEINMYFEVAGDGTHILTPEHAFERSG